MSVSTAVKERPILFSGPMVRAILEGRKAVTRRLVKPQPNPDEWPDSIKCFSYYPTKVNRKGIEIPGDKVFGFANEKAGWVSPYGNRGDRLWVRETWQAIHVSIDPETGYGDGVTHAATIPKSSGNGWWSPVYAATDPNAELHKDDRSFPWRPGIHMPRWVSRINLELTAVDVDRLHEMPDADLRAEGFGAADKSKFADLWDKLNGDGSYASNPFVWVVRFKRVNN